MQYFKFFTSYWYILPIWQIKLKQFDNQGLRAKILENNVGLQGKTK